MNVSKSTVQRLVQSLDADYLKHHTHMARNRIIIDAEMHQRLYQIYHAEPMQSESEMMHQTESLHQSESEKTHQLESELHQTKEKLSQTESLLSKTESYLHQLESMYQSQIDDLRNDKEKLNEQLAVKDNQIQELQKALDQQQQLHRAEQEQHQLLLTGNKGFWKRLFWKGK